MKYLRIWWRLAVMSFATQAVNPLSSFGYLLGKLFRLGFFIVFLLAIFRHTEALAGYSLEQAVLFFLTFNIVDILGQLLFRGIYGIRGIVRDGDFDYFLIQPTNVLWRVCFNTVDFLDVLTIIPVLAVTGWTLHKIPGATDPTALLLYGLLIVNALFIAFAMHIAVAGLSVWTQEMENTIWIYRDLIMLGRFPADIYAAPMRWVMIYIVPVAIMTTFPTKAVLGLLSPQALAAAFGIALISVILSLLFWQFSCRRYTSVSS